MYTVTTYQPSHKSQWDQFVTNSKNGTFLFRRDFMEYHSDRFEDFSLLIFKDDSLVALLPANRKGEEVHSHMGLTYGGLVLSKKLKLNETLLIFQEVLRFFAEDGVEVLHLKIPPTIYQKVPSDELEYLLFISEATLTRVDVSSVIENTTRLKIQSNRIEGVKKAQKQGLEVVEGFHFKEFWNDILKPNLEQRHQAKPVHTIEEIGQLAKQFPKHIHQFNVLKEDKIVAGATIFETNTVAHVQYISANEDKQQLGSLDFLFEYLIQNRFADKKYFDFGISNENQGRNLNKGLLYWKETFGARSIACKFYEVKTINHTKFDNVFL
ncbi:MAG: GNAT family N-acetyltransferase [Flavobacteriaceae bacterium]|nr:GNAT family N-acetyltransferase [Flavobacteriaceae bacterium]